MYGKGEGVPQDFQQAYIWSSLATSDGNETAKKNKDIYAAQLSAADLVAAQQEATARFSKINNKDASTASTVKPEPSASAQNEPPAVQSLPQASSYVNVKFIHPMDFDGSEEQKNNVIEIIKAQVKKDYCDGAVDMCQDTTLRRVEANNLEAFKEATHAKDRKIMDRVIKDYCQGAVAMCSYSTIWRVYQSNLEASQKKLGW
jgi:hypothetical protein